MSTLWEELKQKLEALATGWASYVALGSFALYVLGYLATRFHLTVLGVGTDLSVLDEQYLFAGAKFLVYLVSTAATVLLLPVALWLFALLIHLLYRLVAWRMPGVRRPAGWLRRQWARLAAGASVWATPTRLLLIGIAFSVLFIQVLMRKCYDYANLLVAPELPKTKIGLEGLLLAEGESKALYFAGLMAGTALVFWLLFLARNRMVTSPPAPPPARFLVGLLAFLACVQALLLPVNYGVLIMDKHLPRVSDLGDPQQPLDVCRQGAWLVWEGSHGVTYLLAEAGAAETNSSQAPCIDKTPLFCVKRSLVTVPQKDVKRWQIVGYDQIFKRTFETEGKHR